MSNRLRALYFLYYAAVGANLPYFAAYLRGLGLSGEGIGTALMPAAALGPIAGLAWAAAADRLRAPVRALGVAALGSAVAAGFLLAARSAWAVAAVVLAQALFERAVLPLTDAVALEHARAHPGTSYTGVRLFGSVGFMVGAQGMGVLLDARGDRPADLAVPGAIVLFTVAYALAAQRLPAVAAAPHAPRPRDAAALARDPRLAVLLLGCALHWMACAPYNLLFGVFVRDLRQPSTLIGLGMAVGVAAEVAMLLAYPWVERWLPLRARFALAFAASAARWWLLARATAPATIVLLQVLHGFTFGLFWGCSMSALGALVPPALRVTGQAVYGGVVFGLGNLAGYQLAGLGYDRYGSVAPLLARAAWVEAVLCVLALLAPRRVRRAASR